MLIRLCQLGTRCNHRLEALQLRFLTRLIELVHAVEVVVSNIRVQSTVKVEVHRNRFAEDRREKVHTRLRVELHP